MMDLSAFDLDSVPGYKPWLTEQIRQLSIDALKTNTLTCNACGEIAGTYIVEFEGKAFRLPGEEAYAFLQFITTGSEASA